MQHDLRVSARRGNTVVRANETRTTPSVKYGRPNRSFAAKRFFRFYRPSSVAYGRSVPRNRLVVVRIRDATSGTEGRRTNFVPAIDKAIFEIPVLDDLNENAISIIRHCYSHSDALSLRSVQICKRFRRDCITGRRRFEVYVKNCAPSVRSFPVRFGPDRVYCGTDHCRIVTTNHRITGYATKRTVRLPLVTVNRYHPAFRIGRVSDERNVFRP